MPRIIFVLLGVVLASVLFGCSAGPTPDRVSADRIGVARWTDCGNGTKAWLILREDGTRSRISQTDIQSSVAAAGIDMGRALRAMDDEEKSPCALEIGGQKVDPPPVSGSQVCFQGSTKPFPTVHVCIDGTWFDTGVECDPAASPN